MIKLASLEEEWIKSVARKQKSDPILVEKVVRALWVEMGASRRGKSKRVLFQGYR
jgi:hypothetical protein